MLYIIILKFKKTLMKKIYNIFNDFLATNKVECFKNEQKDLDFMDIKSKCEKYWMEEGVNDI
jgi:hypothetical protein